MAQIVADLLVSFTEVKGKADVYELKHLRIQYSQLTLHLFNMLGIGGLTPPSRRRRNRAPSVHNMGISSANGYGGGGYALLHFSSDHIHVLSSCYSRPI